MYFSRRTKFQKVFFSLLLVAGALALLIRHREIEEKETLKWFDRPVIFVTAPVAGGVLFIRHQIWRVWHRYLHLVGVQKENDTLRAENQAHQTREIFFQGLEKENDRLRQLLELRKDLKGEWMAARVISYPPIGPHRLLTVNQGSAEGVRKRAPVICPDGLVGQVVRTLDHESQILLIIDPTSAVDTRIEGTEARGIVKGKTLDLGFDRGLFIGAFEYLTQVTSEFGEGALVLTSGLDGLYPAGVKVGFVRSRKKKKFDIFEQAEVVPAVDFYKLREVLIQKQ